MNKPHLTQEALTLLQEAAAEYVCTDFLHSLKKKLISERVKARTAKRDTDEHKKLIYFLLYKKNAEINELVTIVTNETEMSGTEEDVHGAIEAITLIYQNAISHYLQEQIHGKLVPTPN